MGASEFVINTIRTGYKLPFLHQPKKAKFRNNQSALRNEEFVSAAIAELLESGRISKMKDPAVVNPLTVSEKGMKKRLILDLRHVNLYLWKDRVKYEDWKTLRNYLRPGSFMFRFDLQSGYHHVEIFEEHQTYLGFAWTDNEMTETYCFRVRSCYSRTHLHENMQGDGDILAMQWSANCALH